MKEISIAIVDNGINMELTKNELVKQVFIDEKNNCKVDYSKNEDIDFQHGTICALILEKYYPYCKLSSIRILNKEGKGEVEKIEPAFEWCYNNNVRLINLSLGTTHFIERKRLNFLINKYTSKGLIIAAATSNIGFCTYPASFTNVIGISAIENHLQYCRDYIHLGIDTAVFSEHTVNLYDEDFKTPKSNSYAVPYITARIAQKIVKDGIYDIYALKRYVSMQSELEIEVGLYNPDWIYKAYMFNRRNKSKAEYFFEEVTGSIEEVIYEIDTFIIYSPRELEQINIGNRNLIYLGKDDFKIDNVHGFIWNWNTRVRQILNNKYCGQGLDIPLIIINIEESLDKYYILYLFRQLFEDEGYNAYIISMEPEGILYSFEYIPDIQSLWKGSILKDFIEGQVYYTKSDLILWNVSKEQEKKVSEIYPDYDIEVIFNKDKILVYIEKKLISEHLYEGVNIKDMNYIYNIIVKYLTEDKDEQ